MSVLIFEIVGKSNFNEPGTRSNHIIYKIKISTDIKLVKIIMS